MVKNQHPNYLEAFRLLFEISLSPIVLWTTESAVWLKSGCALRRDCFLDFFVISQSGTDRPGKEIKIQPDPLPKKNGMRPRA
jgi:hypothetical protein